MKKIYTTIKRLIIVTIAIVAGVANTLSSIIPSVKAEVCPDLKLIFARGSGGERWSDQNYLAFKNSIEEKLQTASLNYEFVDLDYPAIGVGLDNLGVTLGAYFGAGDAFEFGESVNTGVRNLISTINNSSCRQTQFVIGGYSQGAMVVSKALSSLNSDRIIYAATFGDPKLHLPEGKGIIPSACRNENLSDYRMYVPDCQAYKGLLGAYIPYEPEAYTGKVGTWCNKRDVFCSSHLSITDHINYVSENLYEDASRVIYDKITKFFGIENHISSPHDTAFLIDSTGSMAGMIEQYKTEALRLAVETLDAGGRVALYDYRDLADPYEPFSHCDFESCTREIFERELERIVADGGGDDPESLLSSSLKMMKSLNWKFGSTKSLVVLTDAGFLAPDRDGVVLDDVIKLSKQIDPVNFYIITNESVAYEYENLANSTGGKVVTDFDELNLLTDYIMGRFDSLPRVEENAEIAAKPTLEITKSERISEKEIKIEFMATGEKTIVIVNGEILGLTNETLITIGDIDSDTEIMLVPVAEDLRGDGVLVTLTANNINDEKNIFIPKAPNTGKCSY